MTAAEWSSSPRPPRAHISGANQVRAIYSAHRCSHSLPAIPVEVTCYIRNRIHARRCLRVQQSGHVVRQVGRQEGPAQAALRRRRPPARRRVGAFRLSLCF
jgi:hypothetical protein